MRGFKFKKLGKRVIGIVKWGIKASLLFFGIQVIKEIV